MGIKICVLFPNKVKRSPNVIPLSVSLSRLLFFRTFAFVIMATPPVSRVILGPSPKPLLITHENFTVSKGLPPIPPPFPPVVKKSKDTSADDKELYYAISRRLGVWKSLLCMHEHHLQNGIHTTVCVAGQPLTDQEVLSLKYRYGVLERPPRCGLKKA